MFGKNFNFSKIISKNIFIYFSRVVVSSTLKFRRQEDLYRVLNNQPL